MIEIRCLRRDKKFVMPAKAGIQVHSKLNYGKTWIPACAGMTTARTQLRVKISEPRLEPIAT